MNKNATISTNNNFANKAIKIIFIILFAVYPVFVNPFASPVFTHPKVAILWIIGALILVLIAWHYLFELKEKRLGPILLPVSVYSLTLFYSTLFSLNKITSIFGQYSRWDGFITLFSGVLIYCAAIIFIDKDNLKFILRSLLFSILIVSLLSIWEYFFSNPLFNLTKTYDPAGYGRPNTFDFSRPMSTFGSPIYIGAFIVTVLPVLLLKFKKVTDVKNKIFFLIIIIASLIALLLTQARGAWLGFIIAVMILTFYKQIKFKEMVLLFVALIIISFSFSILPAKQANISIFDRFVSIFRIEAGARPQMWDSSLLLVKSNPLTGYGLETYKNTFQRFRPKGWNISLKFPLLDKAHNEVLQVASTSGLIGLCSLIWLIISSLYIAFKNYYQKNSDYILPGFAAGAIAYLVQSFFNFFQVSTSPIFWGFLGILTSGTILTSKRSKPDAWQKLVNKISFPKQFKYIAFVLICFTSTVIIFTSILSWSSDIYFQKYLHYNYEKNIKHSYPAISTAAKLFPHEKRYFISLGKIYGKIAKTKPNFYKYYYNLAKESFSKAKTINPLDEEIYFTSGNIFLDAAKYQDRFYTNYAINNFEAGLKINPSNVDALISLGNAYFYKQEAKKSINVWEKALKIMPNDTNILFNIAIAYEVSGNKIKAIDNYKKALKINPKMLEARNRLRYLK